MNTPIQITLRGLRQSEALVHAIREKAAKLGQFYEPVVNCRVTIEPADGVPRRTAAFAVRLVVNVPGSQIVVTRDQREDLDVALHEAFETAYRDLDEYSRAHREGPRRSAARAS